MKHNRRTDGEFCRTCGKDIVVGFIVNDDVWDKVVGDPNTIRCVMCFDEQAHEKRVEYDFIELFPCPWNYWEEDIETMLEEQNRK